MINKTTKEVSFSELSDRLHTPLLAQAWVEVFFIWIARVVIGIALLTVLSLIGKVFLDAMPRLSAEFLLSFPSRKAEQAGIFSALVGSILVIAMTVAIALPFGVGAALYLEEYARTSRLTRLFELCLANLAGVPSVIYGLLGLQIFVRYCGMGRGLLAGACTLALLILPIIVIASREALRAVPNSYREGAFALGATKWQMIQTQVLPSALPGIMTGCILAFSRALGETAPLLTLGALTYVAFLPDSLFSPFTVIPIQAFNWLSRPQEAFHANAAAAILVLLTLMTVLNLGAIIIRARMERRR